jgi:predicted Fe-Mo cluster-binding NifX family protein
MKTIIAFPSNDKERIEEHFGHAGAFVLVTLENGKETERKSVVPPAHAPGVFPSFLSSQGASAIVTGGMGARAVQLFEANNIDVILGASGFISDNVKAYVEGRLESAGSSCNHADGHEHHHH